MQWQKWPERLPTNATREDGSEFRVTLESLKDAIEDPDHASGGFDCLAVPVRVAMSQSGLLVGWPMSPDWIQVDVAILKLHGGPVTAGVVFDAESGLLIRCFDLAKCMGAKWRCQALALVADTVQPQSWLSGDAAVSSPCVAWFRAVSDSRADRANVSRWRDSLQEGIWNANPRAVAMKHAYNQVPH